MPSLVGKDKTEVGALLPGTDPNIAEMVLATLQANPNAHPAQLMVALIRSAPHPDVATELASALMELILCKEKGHLYWLAMRSHVILTGVKAATQKDGIMYGPAHWPHAALIVGPPKVANVRVSNDQVRRIWMACEGMDGVVVRQSEAIALGNAMIEHFGGHVIEDRQGAEAFAHAGMEMALTKRAKLRAQALSKIDEMIVQGTPDTRPYHARVPCAEALPGSLRTGDRLVPELRAVGDGETQSRPVYEVEARINESWVMLVAVEEGPAYLVGAELWVREDGRKVDPSAPEHYAGFSDEPSRCKLKDEPIHMPEEPKAE